MTESQRWESGWSTWCLRDAVRLFVSRVTGDDLTGDGSSERPFATITRCFDRASDWLKTGTDRDVVIDVVDDAPFGEAALLGKRP